MDRKTLKLLDVNLNTEKTLFFDYQYGEYTFQAFVAQFGVETSALRPQGKNPHDDFHSIAKGAQVAMKNLTINPIGAEIWLRVGCDNVRRRYRIQRNSRKRENVKAACLLLSDGGPSPWDISS